MHKGVYPLIPIIPLSPFSKIVNGEVTHAFAVRPAGTFFCPSFFCPPYCFGCGSAAPRSPRSLRFYFVALLQDMAGKSSRLAQIQKVSSTKRAKR
jgi:hypothetical protein